MDELDRVVHETDVAWQEFSHGQRFACRRRQLGAAAGGQQIGCSLYEMMPGKRNFPFHYHAANEEAVYVLEGEGTLRLGGHEVPLRPGSYVALPAGPGYAHQIVNTSEGLLRFLMISTMIQPEVAVYPDSKKVTVFAGSAPGGPQAERFLHAVFRQSSSVDYWEGEG